VERLASVTQILENAQNIESSVRTTTGDARAVFDELAPLVEDAGNRSQTLQDLNRTAESLAQRNMHLKQESEQATEQIAAMQSSTEAGELLLAEFDRQTQSLAKQLGDLRLKAIQIEEAIAQAITKPTELAADARAQAAQLEQVCTAVRRVFGGLSKASLKAKQQTDDFNRASSEATERFARLTTETGRASSTLHEWIEEAVRVQGRLERSLQQAPSIRETHPSEALLTMSRTLEPAGRLAGPSAGGELQMLSEPETDTEPEKEPIAKPKTRAEEILQMIEDAKRTARVTP
jgi:chromosome segregation ATPase